MLAFAGAPINTNAHRTGIKILTTRMLGLPRCELYLSKR
jgi:hypothetical protein